MQHDQLIPVKLHGWARRKGEPETAVTIGYIKALPNGATKATLEYLDGRKLTLPMTDVMGVQDPIERIHAELARLGVDKHVVNIARNGNPQEAAHFIVKHNPALTAFQLVGLRGFSVVGGSETWKGLVLTALVDEPTVEEEIADMLREDGYVIEGDDLPELVEYPPHYGEGDTVTAADGVVYTIKGIDNVNGTDIAILDNGNGSYPTLPVFALPQLATSTYAQVVLSIDVPALVSTMDTETDVAVVTENETTDDAPEVNLESTSYEVQTVEAHDGETTRPGYWQQPDGWLPADEIDADVSAEMSGDVDFNSTLDDAPTDAEFATVDDPHFLPPGEPQPVPDFMQPDERIDVSVTSLTEALREKRELRDEVEAQQRIIDDQRISIDAMQAQITRLLAERQTAAPRSAPRIEVKTLRGQSVDYMDRVLAEALNEGWGILHHAVNTITYTDHMGDYPIQQTEHWTIVTLQREVAEPTGSDDHSAIAQAARYVDTLPVDPVAASIERAEAWAAHDAVAQPVASVGTGRAPSAIKLGVIGQTLKDHGIEAVREMMNRQAVNAARAAMDTFRAAHPLAPFTPFPVAIPAEVQS